MFIPNTGLPILFFGTWLCAFAMLQVAGALFVNFNMFTVIRATGCMDLLLLGLLAQKPRPVQNFAWLFCFFTGANTMEQTKVFLEAVGNIGIIIPAELSCLLSERKRLVPELARQGQNQREAATRLTLSEFKVKTYMKRIYDNAGASNCKQLLQLQAGVNQIPFRPRGRAVR